MVSTNRSPKELLQFVVAAQGNLPLAAEYAGVTQQQLVALVCGEESASLTENLRGMLMLSIFDTLMQTQIAYRANLDSMSPDGVAKAFPSLLQAFATLTQQPSDDLVSDTRDASRVKDKLITRLDQYKNRQKDKSVEDVS